MQNTRFYLLSRTLLRKLLDIFTSKWKVTSSRIITILLGYYICSTFLPTFYKTINRGSFVVIPIIIFCIEFIIRSKPKEKSKLMYYWILLDNFRIGVTYALVLEAFKLGS